MKNKKVLLKCRRCYNGLTYNNSVKDVCEYCNGYGYYFVDKNNYINSKNRLFPVIDVNLDIDSLYNKLNNNCDLIPLKLNSNTTNNSNLKEYTYEDLLRNKKNIDDNLYEISKTSKELGLYDDENSDCCSDCNCSILEKEVSLHKEINKQLHKELEEKNEDLDLLHNQYKILSESTCQLHIELEEFKEENSYYEARINNLINEVNKLKEENKQLQKDKSELQANLWKLRTLEDDNEFMKRTIDKLEEENKQLKDKLKKQNKPKSKNKNPEVSAINFNNMTNNEKIDSIAEQLKEIYKDDDNKCFNSGFKDIIEHCCDNCYYNNNAMGYRECAKCYNHDQFAVKEELL